MAAHELHEADPAGHAPRLGVGAVEHAHRIFHGAEKPECARDKSDIVIDGLGHPHDGERVAPAPGFMVEVVPSALRAIPADGEQDVHAASDEVVHGGGNVHRAARGAENRAAFVVDVIHELGSDPHRLRAARGIEPAVAAAKSQHFGDTVAVMQFEKERPDNIVEAGAQPPAGHDRRPGFLRVKKQLRARSGQLELEPGVLAGFDPLGDAGVVADHMGPGGGEAGFAERGYLHGRSGSGRFIGQGLPK